jgi:hypothetical protein
MTAWEHHVPLAFHSGREADHSPPSSAEVKEWVELCLHSPNAPSWHGALLGGAQIRYVSSKIYLGHKRKNVLCQELTVYLVYLCVEVTDLWREEFPSEDLNVILCNFTHKKEKPTDIFSLVLDPSIL